MFFSKMILFDIHIKHQHLSLLWMTLWEFQFDYNCGVSTIFPVPVPQSSISIIPDLTRNQVSWIGWMIRGAEAGLMPAWLMSPWLVPAWLVPAWLMPAWLMSAWLASPVICSLNLHRRAASSALAAWTRPTFTRVYENGVTLTCHKSLITWAFVSRWRHSE